MCTCAGRRGSRTGRDRPEPAGQSPTGSEPTEHRPDKWDRRVRCGPLITSTARVQKRGRRGGVVGMHACVRVCVRPATCHLCPEPQVQVWDVRSLAEPFLATSPHPPLGWCPAPQVGYRPCIPGRILQFCYTILTVVLLGLVVCLCLDVYGILPDPPTEMCNPCYSRPRQFLQGGRIPRGKLRFSMVGGISPTYPRCHIPTTPALKGP